MGAEDEDVAKKSQRHDMAQREERSFVAIGVGVFSFLARLHFFGFFFAIFFVAGTPAVVQPADAALSFLSD